MHNAQQHIINKVIVDVNAKSRKTAFALKDNLDVFLKEDIFPYLETYFKTLEVELPSDSIQIPKLTLEVTSDSSNNFEALKTTIKTQLKKELKELINNPEVGSNKAIFLSTTKSKQDTFIYFLENGTIPWWESIDKSTMFHEETLIELLKSHDFKTLFKRKIEVLNNRNRFVKQFFNHQIIKLLQGVFKNEIIALLKTDKTIHTEINQLKPEYKQWIWHEIIQYCLHENKDNLVSKIENLLKSKIIIENDTIVQVILKLLKTISTKTDITFNRNKPIKINEDYENEIIIKQKLEGTESFSEEKAIETNNLIKQKKFLEDDSTIENKKEEEEHSEQNHLEEKYAEQEWNENRTASNETKEKLENKTTIKDKEAVKNKEASTNNKEEQNSIESKQNDNTEVSTETKNTRTKTKESSEENLEKEVTNTKAKTEAKEAIVENNENQLEDETTALKAKTSSEEKSVQEEAILKPETSKTLSRANENEALEASGIDKKVSQIIKQEQLEQLFTTKNKGEYYVKNAGLIILHPYLKTLFTNCELLNEAGKIINPELAIHLLHYLATKKEQQYESNMAFEKFLCGIAIEQSIRREIIIPEALKLKAETLLEAVVTHWETLNNPSTDLLRHEFLQRAGKLSFKNENPKIVVERKVFDLLLDKLPWTLSLSKLPWIDKLIYTDW